MPDCSCPDSAQHHLQCKYMHSILNQSTPGIHCQQCCVLNESCLFQPEQLWCSRLDSGTHQNNSIWRGVMPCESNSDKDTPMMLLQELCKNLKKKHWNRENLLYNWGGVMKTEVVHLKRQKKINNISLVNQQFILKVKIHRKFCFCNKTFKKFKSSKDLACKQPPHLGESRKISMWKETLPLSHMVPRGSLRSL